MIFCQLNTSRTSKHDKEVQSSLLFSDVRVFRIDQINLLRVSLCKHWVFLNLSFDYFIIASKVSNETIYQVLFTFKPLKYSFERELTCTIIINSISVFFERNQLCEKVKNRQDRIFSLVQLLWNSIKEWLLLFKCPKLRHLCELARTSINKFGSERL